MNTTLLALAIAPGLAIAIYIFWKDKFEREPKRLMLFGFILGAISIVPAVLLEYLWGKWGYDQKGSTLDIAFFAFVVVGFSEEISKYFFLKRFLYTRSAFNEPYDGITYSVMVSMGFATLENIMYVADGGINTAFMRMATAVPAHAVFAIVMGYYVGLAKFDEQKRTWHLMMGVVGATLLHGAYDFSLMQQDYKQLQFLGAMFSLYVGIRLSQKAIKLHQDNSPFRNEE
jgi:RsiW-degrading membrane proteinase PrsW (M82 family)